MNKRLLILMVLIAGNIFISGAQVIITDPVFPTATGTITLTFYADKGNMALKDYTGDIYAHTGVITNLSTSDSDWKYVLASWSENIAAAKMTRQSANIYTLTISPSIRDFYGVPAGEEILKMAFVFRNSDGSLQGKTSSDGDIFYDVITDGVFAARMVKPDNYTSLVYAGQVISVMAAASVCDSLKLFQNEVEIAKVTETTLNQYLSVSGTGLFKLTARAWYNTEVREDSVFYFVRTSTVTAAVPDGLSPGVNITGDNSATFLLYAPGKTSVYVLGDFNDWVYSGESIMKKSPDGDWFWLEVNGLDPLMEYRFQYIIDESIRIPDPYSSKILDPWNDKYIDDETYPGLNAYPEGLAENLVSVFQTRPEEYQWKNSEFTPPAKEDLVIYELLVRDFVAAHDFNTINDSLDYFARLGINAIEFMPVCEFEGNSSWGYNPSMYFAVDKYYGPAETFKRLIDSCHSKGIAVIMDMVLNHAYGLNPLVRMYYDKTTYKVTADNPWFNVDSPNSSYSWGYDFNHSSDETRAFVDSVCHYWIDEFRVDGYRFDFSKGFTNTAGDGWAYDAARIANLKRIAGEVWSYRPDAYLILEHFTDNAEEKVLDNYGFMLWGDAKNSYLEAAMGYSSDLSEASYLELGWTQPGLVTYMESHDEERMMYKNITYGNSGTNYNITDQETALKRVKLAATFFFTIPGPKMIWQFEELGYDYTLGTGDAKLAEKPIRWDYYTEPLRRNLYNNFKALIELKKNNETFSSDNFTLYETGKMKRLNVIGTDMDALALGNFDVSAQNISSNFTREGKWYEFFSGDSITVTTGTYTQTMNLQPGEYRLYTSSRIARPNFLTALDDVFIDKPDSQMPFVACPNPFTSATAIFFTEEQTDSKCTVEVYSSVGVLIRRMNIPAGSVKFDWDGRTSSGSEVPSGVYYIVISSDKGQTAGKVIKL